MANTRAYISRQNYRFLDTERLTASLSRTSSFELHESDIYNSSAPRSDDSPEPLNKPSSLDSLRLRNSKQPARRPPADSRRVGSGAPSSLPVNIPDWSKILREEYRENRRRGDNLENDFSNDEDDEDGEDDGFSRVPPHEFLARTRMASLSVHEGVGRTLKGRDLSRVRNAIWEKIGFQD